MEFNVEINPEQVNQLVADAVLQSAIGKELERIVKDHVDRLNYSRPNPIETVVKREMELIVSNLIREQYHESIREKITEKITEKFTDDLFEKLWTAFERDY